MSLRQRKTKKKKQEILRSAAEVLYEKGYHGTTMEEIASRLLMTKGSMYYYFRNKEELLYRCHMTILEISLQKIEDIMASTKSPTDKLRDAIVSHIELSISEKKMFAIIDNPDQTFSGDNLTEIVEQRSKYARYFDEILKEGIETKEFVKVDVKMTRFIILGALNWIQQWYSPEGNRSKEEISQTFSNYLLKMVLG
jgi:AcrR family transcriptional regulator